MDPLALRPLREQFNRLLDDFGQIKVDRFEMELARFDLRKVENVVDHGQEHVAAGAGGFDEIALLRSEAGLQQKSGHADHAVQGRADFMAHVGQEFALRPAGLLGGPFGFAQFILGAFSPGDVARDALDAHRFAALENEARIDLQGDAVAIAGDVFNLVGCDAAMRELLLKHLPRQFPMVGRHQVLGLQGEDFLAVVTGQPQPGLIGRSVIAFQIVGVNEVIGVFHQVAIPLFQSRFAFQPLADHFGLPADAAAQGHHETASRQDHHHHRPRHSDSAFRRPPGQTLQKPNGARTVNRISAFEFLHRKLPYLLDPCRGRKVAILRGYAQ